MRRRRALPLLLYAPAAQGRTVQRGRGRTLRFRTTRPRTCAIQAAFGCGVVRRTARAAPARVLRVRSC